MLFRSRGISQAALAKMLGVSAPAVSQMLAAEANLTVRKVAEVLFSLGLEGTIGTRPRDARVVRPAPSQYSLEVEARAELPRSRACLESQSRALSAVQSAAAYRSAVVQSSRPPEAASAPAA